MNSRCTAENEICNGYRRELWGFCTDFTAFLAAITVLPQPMKFSLLHSHIDTFFGIQ